MRGSIADSKINEFYPHMRICVVIMLIQPPEIPVHCLSSCEDMCCNAFRLLPGSSKKVYPRIRGCVL